MLVLDEARRRHEDRLAGEDALTFEVIAARNRMLAEWATTILQLPPADAADYSGALVELGFVRSGEEAILDKLMGDFRSGGIEASAEDISAHMQRLLAIAEERVRTTGWRDAIAA